MELFYLYYFAVFYLGAILGSFLNVVALDIHKLFRENELENRNELLFFARHVVQKYFWQSLMQRRSHCDSCNANLKTFELFPVFSYLLQRGKCRKCGAHIDASHFWVEIASGFFFLGIFMALFVSTPLYSLAFVGQVFYWFTFFGILFVLALFDLRTKLIPDVLLVLATVMLMIALAVVNPVQLAWHLGAGLLFAALFFGVWRISRGTWMGFADGKLAFIVGLLLGFSAGFTALAIAFWSGAIVSVALLAYTRIRGKGGLSISSAVPFGPFLVFGIWYVFVTGLNLFQII